MSISYKDALTVISAALAKAEDMGINMCLCVVDTGGIQKMAIRMDNAWAGSVEIAEKKAKTSALFAMPSGEIGKLSQPGKPLYQIEGTNNGLVSFPGGYPIVVNGKLIGAIGASGSTVDDDLAVSIAGVEGLTESKLPKVIERI